MSRLSPRSWDKGKSKGGSKGGLGHFLLGASVRMARSSVGDSAGSAHLATGGHSLGRADTPSTGERVEAGAERGGPSLGWAERQPRSGGQVGLGARWGAGVHPAGGARCAARGARRVDVHGWRNAGSAEGSQANAGASAAPVGGGAGRPVQRLSLAGRGERARPAAPAGGAPPPPQASSEDTSQYFVVSPHVIAPPPGLGFPRPSGSVIPRPNPPLTRARSRPDPSPPWPVSLGGERPGPRRRHSSARSHPCHLIPLRNSPQA